MKRTKLLIGLILIVTSCVWGVCVPTAFGAAPETTADPSWTIYFRPGVRFGSDDRTLFIMDFLVPLYRGDKDIVFFNPKLTPDDHDGLEVNLGIGYRRLLFDDRVILGGNVFYDNRRTGWGTRWEQIGLGVEAMAEFNKYVALTGRFNYYIPLTDPKVSGTGGPATGYYFHTGGIWTGGGGSVEESPEGFDGEVGVRIPVVSDYVETWVYGGGYHYHGKHVGSIDGWTVRVEAIPTGFLRLSYEYSDDNTPSHGEHHGEVAFEVPCSIDNLVAGKNPFEGIGRRLSGSRDFKERMVEPVRRDPDIRVIYGGSGDPGTLVEGVVFVSESATAGTGTGTFENPFASIDEAVAAINSGGIYSGITTIHVMDDGGDYAGGGTVDIASLLIWGSGMPHPTYGTITNQYLTSPDIYELDITADGVEIFGGSFVDDYGVVTSGSGTLVHDNTFNGNDNAGVYITGGTSTITGNSFTNCYSGTYTLSGTATISGNTFTGGNYGVYTSGGTTLVTENEFNNISSGCGAYLNGGSVTITDNTFTGDRYGVLVGNGTATISENTIVGGVYGVSGSGGTFTITDNTIGTDANPMTVAGIELSGGTINEISGNTITVYNSSTSVYGILSYIGDLVLSGNDITVTSGSNSAYGIFCRYGGNITGSITGGTINATGSGEATGIYLYAFGGPSSSVGESGNAFEISGVEIDAEATSTDSPFVNGIYLRGTNNIYADIDLDGSTIDAEADDGFAYGIYEEANNNVYGSITDADGSGFINLNGLDTYGVYLIAYNGAIGGSGTGNAFEISDIELESSSIGYYAYGLDLLAGTDIYMEITDVSLSSTANLGMAYGICGTWNNGLFGSISGGYISASGLYAHGVDLYSNGTSSTIGGSGTGNAFTISESTITATSTGNQTTYGLYLYAYNDLYTEIDLGTTGLIRATGSGSTSYGIYEQSYVGSIYGYIMNGTITADSYYEATGIFLYAPDLYNTGTASTVGGSGDPFEITGTTINATTGLGSYFAYGIRIGAGNTDHGYIYATITGNTANVTSSYGREFLRLESGHDSGNVVDWGSVPNTLSAYDLSGNPAVWTGNYDAGGGTPGPVYTNFTTGLTP